MTRRIKTAQGITVVFDSPGLLRPCFSPLPEEALLTRDDVVLLYPSVRPETPRETRRRLRRQARVRRREAFWDDYMSVMKSLTRFL